MLRLRHAAQQPHLSSDASGRPRPAVLVRAGVGLVGVAALAAFLAVPSFRSAVSADVAAPRTSAPTSAPLATVPAASAAGSAGSPAPSAAPSGAPPSVPQAVGAIAPAAAASATPSPSATPTPPPSNTTLTPALSSALTKLLGQLRVKYGIPGVQATIIFANGQSWRAHAGVQDYAARTPVGNATPFPVASVTKTFIAALTVQLAGEGRFNLDDPLIRYLPKANVDKRVTIRELLDHTSGTYDFFNNSAIDTALLGCRSCLWTPSRALSYVKKPLFAPGTHWSYSNTGYVLLGQLDEAVTGQSYASMLQERFFAPLRLITTYVQGQQPAPYPIVHSYQFFTSSIHEKPTSLWDGTGVSPFRSVTTAAGSAGDIASSSRDLAVWARALYSGRVLGTEGSKAMLDFGPTLAVHSSVPYGLGVEEFTVAGRQAVGHGGRLLGARSAIRYLPSEGVSIAVVINTDRGDPGVIANDLASLALPPLPSPTPSPTASP
jgi:CubicO group peptidase (beta-lactamase class C family)